MILRIELWDFESHEHTVLDGISPAVNLLCGESNSGKTSIVRALKLAAYNEFDPKSVRVGATKCSVQVDTERGRVKVTRGEKHNLWEITKNGQPTQYFDKVGVNIVPEAEEIIGLNIITLGDVQVPVNIMDQLESHFMLAGVGDKKASGSMRAQIVDEISGLSGIEGIIKDVSLDHHRFGREIKEIEMAMEKIRTQIHPEASLNAEEDILVRAEKELTDRTAMLGLVTDGNNLVKDGERVRTGILAAEQGLSAIPDTDTALAEIGKAEDRRKQAASADGLYREGKAASWRLEGIRKTLAGMPDFEAARGFLDASERAGRKLVGAVSLLGQWKTADQGVKGKQEREQEVTEALKSKDELKKVDDLLSIRIQAEALLGNTQRVAAAIQAKRQGIASKDLELKMAEKDRDDLLASITTCPLTLRPVSKECLEGVAV